MESSLTNETLSLINENIGYRNVLKDILKNVTNSADITNQREAQKTFEPYWGYNLVVEGLEAKTLYEGVFHVNSRKRENGYVVLKSCIYGKEDIHIIGYRHRNRAFEGDIVVVKILSNKNKWVKNHGESKPTGRIVYITELNHPRTSIGKITKLEIQKSITSLAFQSLDPCIPTILIFQKFQDWRTKQNDSSPFSSVFYYQSAFMQELRYYCKIKSWQISDIAYGELVDVISDNSKAVQFHRELNDLIAKYKLQVRNPNNYLSIHSQYYKRVSFNSKLYITEFDKKQRVDYTNDLVFTFGELCDLENLSVAFCCKLLSSEFCEVKIYVTDVHHYLMSNENKEWESHQKNQVDTKSKGRAKKNKNREGDLEERRIKYLNDHAKQHLMSISAVKRSKIISTLLPSGLRDICSLTPGNRKLVFCITFAYDKEGTLVSNKIEEAIIIPTCHISYSQAHNYIDNPNKTDWSLNELPYIKDDKTKTMSNETFKQLKASLIKFYKISKHLSNNNSNYLRIPQPDINYNLKRNLNNNKYYTIPISIKNVDFKVNDFDSFIDYWKYNVNKIITKKIIDIFPNKCLLLKQNKIDNYLLDSLQKLLLNMKENINLINSWKNFINIDKNYNLIPVLIYYFDKMITKPEYYVSSISEEVCHYTTNEKYYTDMCSPLHNFPHIVVQGQLHSALLNNCNDGSLASLNTIYLKSMANQYNILKSKIEILTKRTNEMYIASILGDNSLITKAIVVEVHEHSFEIIIPSIYFVSTVYLDTHKTNTVMKSGQWTHEIQWLSPNYKQLIKHLTAVDVKCVKCEYSYAIKTMLCHPKSDIKTGLYNTVELNVQDNQDQNSTTNICSSPGPSTEYGEAEMCSPLIVKPQMAEPICIENASELYNKMLGSLISNDLLNYFNTKNEIIKDNHQNTQEKEIVEDDDKTQETDELEFKMNTQKQEKKNHRERKRERDVKRRIQKRLNRQLKAKIESNEAEFGMSSHVDLEAPTDLEPTTYTTWFDQSNQLVNNRKTNINDFLSNEIDSLLLSDSSDSDSDSNKKSTTADQLKQPDHKSPTNTVSSPGPSTPNVDPQMGSDIVVKKDSEPKKVTSQIEQSKLTNVSSNLKENNLIQSKTSAVKNSTAVGRQSTPTVYSSSSATLGGQSTIPTTSFSSSSTLGRQSTPSTYSSSPSTAVGRQSTPTTTYSSSSAILGRQSSTTTSSSSSASLGRQSTSTTSSSATLGRQSRPTTTYSSSSSTLGRQSTPTTSSSSMASLYYTTDRNDYYYNARSTPAPPQPPKKDDGCSVS